jgi:dienelactone hydrolase
MRIHRFLVKRSRVAVGRTRSVIFSVLAGLGCAWGQTSPATVRAILARPIQPTAVTADQLQRYMTARIPKLPARSGWEKESQDLRRHLLDDIAFHGWPADWVKAPLVVREAGEVEGGEGYRLKKLQIEILPDFWTTAILYEPTGGAGKRPAILNVNGHDPIGKAAEYKQKRCINYAKRGIVALNLEWLACGELHLPEDAHDFGAHLDLVGANALGLFYLAMRKGLDVLASLPEVDTKRLGVTGLSGGGWQTIVLGALDERVFAAAEDAGFGSLESNITHPIDTDEVEETPQDFLQGQDYTHLVAMRAPRPTLLIHNAEDTCCFRAALVKPYIYDQIKPIFRWFSAEGALQWHENLDPGTHNYEIDNRQAAYAFFLSAFGMDNPSYEIPSGRELKTSEQLTVGLPEGNLTILGVAKRLASRIERAPIPTSPPQLEPKGWAAAERLHLKDVVRYKQVFVKNAWRLWNTKARGLDTLSYRFDYSDGLSATGVWLKAMAAPDHAHTTIVLDDKGKKEAGEVVSDRVNREEQVLALDLLFNGEVLPQTPDSTDYELLVASLGSRPLGIETAQLVAAARWLAETSGNKKVRVETDGIRSQVVALTAAALEPALFSDIVVRNGMKSLAYLLDKPVPFRSAPELFCLDLYKDFDLDRLEAMASPVAVERADAIEPPKH